MRVRRTALGAATQPIAASYLGSGYNRLREQVAPPLPHWFCGVYECFARVSCIRASCRSSIDG